MMKKQVLILFLFLLFGSSSLAQRGLFTGHGRPSQPPPTPSQPRPLQPRLRRYSRLPLGLNAVGPESVAFDCQGHGPYVGVSDGRILRWENTQGRWTEFAVTNPNRSRICDGINNSPIEQYCGRPLGLKFNTVTCELYVTDSSVGLVKVDPNGNVVSLATSVEGKRFHFLNDLDIDSEGSAVYFTDTSSVYNRWSYEEAMERGDRSGTLMRYDIKTGKIIILLRELSFANGVALSKNKDFVLVAETTASQIRKLWLTGPTAGNYEIFLSLDGGRPDNINRNADGDFWIAQNPKPPIKVDEHGNILEVLNSDQIVDDSDVSEVGDIIWIGSVDQSYLLYAI